MPLKVIGAGLGRTGTLSLKLALERLGFGPCFHMAEMFINQDRAPLWVDAAEGRPNWEAIFKGYPATTDYPACIYWRELASAYPSAKVILTLRDADKWFESTQATIFSEAMSERIRSSPAPIVEMFEKTLWKDFGDRIHDHDFMIEHFERHNAAVKAGVPKKRLLVYEVSEGWGPLCDFLDVDVPDAPFPNVNSREELQSRMATGLNEQTARDYLRDSREKQSAKPKKK
jgi:hypothetical protein